MFSCRAKQAQGTRLSRTRSAARVNLIEAHPDPRVAETADAVATPDLNDTVALHLPRNNRVAQPPTAGGGVMIEPRLKNIDRKLIYGALCLIDVSVRHWAGAFVAFYWMRLIAGATADLAVLVDCGAE
ncbi:hypothetical protein EVAR_83343_1 [Eumeta japonica]|uniref:Uncharacterized protein n=1 Tax=Eumeta variegata TaxID=151549 RepID=A0A4C1VY23_EUMVA|nr:hypothetical protein EVAR_83343_1 [Eumeta japonica]